MAGWKIDHSKPTALYRLFDAADSLLYIGIAFAPEVRWRAHAKAPWDPLIARKEVRWFPDRLGARAEELRLIRSLQPTHNIAETPRKRWKPGTAAPPGKRHSNRKLPTMPSTRGAGDVMTRLARQVRRETRSTARLERWVAIEYEAGGSLRDIAAVAGRSPEGVRKILAKHGVPIRSRGRAKPASTEGA